MATNQNYPKLDSAASDSERVAAIRAVLQDFDWELDDRQNALEAVESYVFPPNYDALSG
jgi:hypothetical protein